MTRRGGVAVLAAGVALCLLFVGLGIWQIERRGWKNELIARSQSNARGPAVPAPGPAGWAGVTREADEYRRVVTGGTYQNDKETLVQAVTALGGGFWVMTPLVTDEGWTVLVNRGFVPEKNREASTRMAGQIPGSVTVEGLLRITEPHGAFLRANDPEGDRWRSRDVAAIAKFRGLDNVAPYFIDSDAAWGTMPRGGMTVLSFPNNHLVYAFTWFALAGLAGFGLAYVLQERWRPSA